MQISNAHFKLEIMDGDWKYYCVDGDDIDFCAGGQRECMRDNEDTSSDYINLVDDGHWPNVQLNNFVKWRVHKTLEFVAVISHLYPGLKSEHELASAYHIKRMRMKEKDR